jgi:hypothetical protein
MIADTLDMDHAEGMGQSITCTLYRLSRDARFYPKGVGSARTSSSVLFLLGSCRNGRRGQVKTCLVLNKRSRAVRQPGDLCFPGGRTTPLVDTLLSRLIRLPFLPLGRWPFWQEWRTRRPNQARRLSLLLATGLRESLEEMRLNPAGIRFLGPLPAEDLTMFDRVIYPMVGWITRQKRFVPNWEVERVVYLPIKDLLNREQYARYRLHIKRGNGPNKAFYRKNSLCYRHETEKGTEILWGVTFRIILVFIKQVFDFDPPPIQTLPVIDNILDETYFNGSR